MLNHHQIDSVLIKTTEIPVSQNYEELGYQSI